MNVFLINVLNCTWAVQS